MHLVLNTYTKILFFLGVLLYSLTLSVSAQNADSTITLYGKLYDSKDYAPVEFAHVINMNRAGATITDSSGFFQLRIQAGDTLFISCIGYEDARLSIPKYNPVIFKSIPMNKRTYEISSVEIRPWKTYEDFKKKFMSLKIDDPREDVHPLLWQDMPTKPLDPVPHHPTIMNPVSFFYEVFSGERKARMKYNEILSKETKKRKIRSKFNEEIVGDLTGLEGKQLEEFIDFCNFTDEQLLEMNEYEVLQQVKRKYQLFKEEYDINKNR